MKKIITLCFTILLAHALNAQSNNITLLGHLSYGTETCAGVWHYVDTAGNEYAIVGASDRLSIVDVTNPSTPVEVASVPALSGQASLWREVKTYGNYAYAVSEGGGGVMIVDLSALPAVTSKHWYGDTATSHLFNSAHAIAATDGYLYIFGSSYGNGGCFIASIADPWNPVFAGLADQRYIHDGYIRNDTLWAGEIYQGQFAVIDVSDKANPVYITTQPTPGAFNHNTWLSDNGQYLFTTDEQNNTPVGAFDVSDISNIQLVGVRYNDSIPNEEVHNVRVYNDYLINPSYGSQITIWDAARPSNMIEIAHYPTGNFLCWDASPFLPSGNLIVTDVDGGFYVFAPNYVRASYLEGNVTDSITGLALNNVSVKILGASKQTQTNLNGDYKTGIVGTGTYDIEFSKPGYLTKTIPNVNLTSGVLTLIDIQLTSYILSGQVQNAVNLQGVANASLHFDNGSYQLDLTADGNGNFITSGLPSGNYTVTITSWGYKTICNNYTVNENPLILQLTPGYYYDDFTSNNGWTVNSTATTGAWVREVPHGTMYGVTPSNPAQDVTDDCSNICYVTGNTGVTANDDDVDDGQTTLTSPVFDLTSYTDPYLHYSRWFFIQQSTALANRDTLFISLTNGIDTVMVETATWGMLNNSTWVNSIFRISNYITPTSNMRLIVSISDKVGSGNLLEAGFDHFEISEGVGLAESQNKNSTIHVYPNPFNTTINLHIDHPVTDKGMQLIITDITGREMMRKRLFTNDVMLNTDELISNGIYLLYLSDDKDYYETIKLVKNN